MSVAVLWTAEDARRLLLDTPKVSSAIGLTPVSRIKELDIFVEVINNQDNFNNIKQAYLIEKVETLRDYFRARYPKNMIDTYLMWSPLGLAAADISDSLTAQVRY